MGDRTAISWTDATWNSWVGCHKVSEACQNCYFYRDAKRYGRDASIVQRTSPATFNAPLKWARNPEKYSHIKRIFTCSWSDFFIEEADVWRAEAWEIIRRTPQFTYQILTKRPERMEACLPKDFLEFDHVWLGVTGENQKRLDTRLYDFYTNSSSRIAFVSIEPMLSKVDVYPYLNWIDWVICGCESGPNARNTKLEWVRDLRDQCVAANVPFFLKQLCIDGKLVTTPELDGRQWTEFPEVAHV
jgi:protein gp37